MPSKIFVNLPVKDLAKSMDFFKHLGFSFNLQFTDEKAACLVINDGSIYAMLLTEPFFKGFTKKAIADATKTTEVLIALDMESKDAVNEIVSKALEAGGSTYSDPMDHGWMYQHAFADPDGHQWEVMFMDESALPNQ
ncbi:VOC family protein [Echinicola sediminis]